MEAISQALEALPAHFAGVAPSRAAAEQAFQAAFELMSLVAERQPGFDAGQSRRLER